MRTRLLLVALILALPACRTAGTYSERGEHIELMKDLLDDYTEGRWFALGTAYADSAMIFVNGTIPMTIGDRLAALQAQRAVFDEVAIVNPLFGEVHNADGEIWVLAWGSWEGRAAGMPQRVSVPLHIAAEFVDGKIVQEWTYMDGAPLESAMAALRAMPDSTAGTVPDSVAAGSGIEPMP